MKSPNAGSSATRRTRGTPACIGRASAATAGRNSFRAASLKARDENDDGTGNSGGYDRFRDRLMFPISNEVGEVIGYSGRVLTADAQGAKYVNSPESPIFTKGKVLFGLHRSKRAIIDQKFAIVCEGQIDLITAFEAGVLNVIAPQGTAFTEQQARLLKRHADEVVLCFDADNAGQAAAEKSLPSLAGGERHGQGRHHAAGRGPGQPHPHAGTRRV